MKALRFIPPVFGAYIHAVPANGAWFRFPMAVSRNVRTTFVGSGFNG